MGIWDWISEKLSDIWDKIKDLVDTTEDLDTRLKETRDDLTFHLDPVTGQVYLKLDETRSDAARWAREEAQKVNAALERARLEYDQKIAEGDDSVRRELRIEIHEIDTKHETAYDLLDGKLDTIKEDHQGWLSRLENIIRNHLQPAISEITTSLTNLAASLDEKARSLASEIKDLDDRITGELKKAWKEIAWLTNPVLFGAFLVDKVLDKLLFEEEDPEK